MVDELTRSQLEVAFAISDKNTAPEEAETVEPEDIPLPDDTLLEDNQS